MHTILVADDSVTIQRAVEIVFDKEPFTVVKAGSGAEAMARVRELRPHLVLADHTMGDQSGYDLAAALKADPATAGIPVVLMSNAANPYDEGRGGASGIAGHVQKPFDCATMLERVRTILGVEATAPGTFVSATPTATAATANMPRPPSLGGFGGLPRPAVPTFPPRPASLTSPAAVSSPPAPAPRGLDPFGLEAALSQPPVAAAPQVSVPPTVTSTPPQPAFAPASYAPAAPLPSSIPTSLTPQAMSAPLSSPTSVASISQSGWQAMAPGQSISLPSAPTPAPTPAPVHAAAHVVPPPAPTPTPGQSFAGLADETDFASVNPAPAAFAGLSSTPTPAPSTGWAASTDLSKSTAKLDLSAIAAADVEADAEDLLPTNGSTASIAMATAAATAAVVAKAAPAIEAATGAVPSREVLSAEARTIIERIAWEVVPELAELIIKEELARLLKARGV